MSEVIEAAREFASQQEIVTEDNARGFMDALVVLWDIINVKKPDLDINTIIENGILSCYQTGWVENG